MKITGDDYAEVMNLYAYYNLSSDGGTPEEYASCFTPDGILKFDHEQFKRGRKALIEFKTQDQGGRQGRYRRHWNGAIHLDKVDAGTIRGRCYLQAFNGDPGGEPLLSDSAVYEDLIVNVDGHWKFAVRDLAFDFRRKQ